MIRLCGYRVPFPLDRKETTDYFSSTSSGGSDYTRADTCPVLNIGPKPVGTEIVVTGTVTPNQFTETSLLLLFISV